jgi:Uma2 family endonuclease
MTVPPYKGPATYADVLAAPEHQVAEVVDGKLHLSPHWPSPVMFAAGELFGQLFTALDKRRGWIFLMQPELHLGSEPAIVVPDIAGWWRERMPAVENVPYLTLVPDWLCEVLSPSTESFDRTQKLAIYARAGVRFCWLINPLARILEVLGNQGNGLWSLLSTHGETAKVRAQPFETHELDLSLLWTA